MEVVVVLVIEDWGNKKRNNPNKRESVRRIREQINEGKEEAV